MATIVFLLFVLGYNLLAWFWRESVFFSVVFFPLSIILSVLSIVLLIIILMPIFKFMKPNNRFFHYYVRSIFFLVLWLLNFRIKVHGKENLPEHQKFVLFPNHKSYCDILIVMTRLGRPISIIAKREVFKIPIMSSYMKTAKVVPLNRGSDREALLTIKKGIENLENNIPMIIFPEGGRKNREDDKMVEMRAGAYKLATKPKADIIPVSIKGSAKISKTWIFGRKRIDLYFHKPLTAAEYAEISTNEIGEIITTTVNSVL
ncbi:MAG: 1-acyl-sn-glycerol-3-phosphate acyltransferase [Erysipelotrichales bacterium]|nr:1-acyl-sn-glycerol-3-phosphate acyltransferase [Erysipelotrichales bacterium]